VANEDDLGTSPSPPGDSRETLGHAPKETLGSAPPQPDGGATHGPKETTGGTPTPRGGGGAPAPGAGGGRNVPLLVGIGVALLAIIAIIISVAR
jgi:hypothetical protein